MINFVYSLFVLSVFLNIIMTNSRLNNIFKSKNFILKIKYFYIKSNVKNFKSIFSYHLFWNKILKNYKYNVNNFWFIKKICLHGCKHRSWKNIKGGKP